MSRRVGVVGRHPVEFNDRALSYVREQLDLARRDFGGLLAAKLVGVQLQEPFAFVEPGSETAGRDFDSGGVDEGDADGALAAVLGAWLGESDPGYERVVLLEDPLARHSDPAVDKSWPHLGEKVFYLARAVEGSARVKAAFRALIGYPGIGIVSRPRGGVVEYEQLRQDALDEAASGAVAVLVRAWDEAFLVAPVRHQNSSRHALPLGSATSAVDGAL